MDFCNVLSPNETPVRLVPQPTANDRLNYCFPNVLARIEKDGGEMVCGWAIWEMPGFLIEGEFHAVWRTTTGEIVDVSPLAPEDHHRTFLPDPALKWEGFRRDNVRKFLGCAADEAEILNTLASLIS